MTRVAVLGAGAWGTAIAAVLSARLEVTLWARDPVQAERLAATRRNERYLPGVELPDALGVTSNFSRATTGTALFLAATPVAGLREIAQKLSADAPLVWLCKGFEEGTGLLPHELVPQKRCGALSGPSFADEVARGLPTATTLAAAREMELFQLPLVRAVVKGRELILGAAPDGRPRPRGRGPSPALDDTFLP